MLTLVFSKKIQTHFPPKFDEQPRASNNLSVSFSSGHLSRRKPQADVTWVDAY